MKDIERVGLQVKTKTQKDKSKKEKNKIIYKKNLKIWINSAFCDPALISVIEFFFLKKKGGGLLKLFQVYENINCELIIDLSINY